MSKSLGNFVYIKDIFKKYDGQTLRFFLLNTHYRSPLNFTIEALKASGKGLQRIHTFVYTLKNLLEEPDIKRKHNKSNLSIENSNDKFIVALEDDFNVPKAVAVIFDFIREVNNYMDAGGADKKILTSALDFVLEAAFVFGISVEKSAPVLVDDLLEVLMDLRDEFRLKKDFKSADRIRDLLLEKGIKLEDGDSKTFWKFV